MFLDVNECENSDGSDSLICGAATAGTCSNTPSGSYTCECAPGSGVGGQATPCTGKDTF